jgi:hypothetical protein
MDVLQVSTVGLYSGPTPRVIFGRVFFLKKANIME